MLLQLNIQNFAIVRSLEIEWRQGMTTITGETGAGKSIAIDALGLCLGDRAVTNIVRPNCTKAELSATFLISKNPIAKQWLEKHELSLDSECILRRVISAEGRSRAFINGSQVPLTQLKELGALLINIHGQHDHQLIVKNSEQRRMLDEYAKHDELLNDVTYYFKKWRKLKQEITTLEESKSQRESKLQLLQYQVKELNEFSLQAGEFNELEQDYKRHSNGQDILNQTVASLNLLSENEQYNVIDMLRKCNDNINQLSEFDNSLNNLTEMLNGALVQLEEANTDLWHYQDKLELDPQAFIIIEERYSLAIQLAKKHQITPENIVDFHHGLNKELANITTDESRLDGVYLEIEQVKQQYQQAAIKLSISRQNFAKKLSKKITASMKELNMDHGQFQINVIQQDNLNEPTSQGIDDIEFLISLNPGQALEAMNKVASGGELSRISLAMQVILAQKIISPALIFDEVDVGISGPTADMVGNKLKELAANTQVICVTHLPQVASKGHQQMFVAKLTDGAHTETTVTELSEQGRVKEIARLLAGNKISEHSLANAKELLAS
jgi:DNA repair protein RecN (Recombination protein N)